MSDSDSDLSSAPASPRTSRVTPARAATPSAEAGPSSAVSPTVNSSSTAQGKKRTSAPRPSAPTRVPSGRAKRTRQVYSPSEGSSSRQSSTVPPSKPVSSAPTPPAEAAPTPPADSAPTPPGPGIDPRAESLTPPPPGSQSKADGGRIDDAATSHPSAAGARPRGKKRKSDEAALAAEHSAALGTTKPAVPKLKLKLGGSSKVSPAAAEGGPGEVTGVLLDRKSKKAKKAIKEDVGNASNGPPETSTTVTAEDGGAADSVEPGARQQTAAASAKGEAKKSIAKKKKRMVVDSDDEDDGDGDGDFTPGAESAAAAEMPRSEVDAARSGLGIAKKKEKKKSARKSQGRADEENTGDKTTSELDATADVAPDSPPEDTVDKPTKPKKVVKPDTTADPKNEAQEKADGADAEVRSSKEKAVKQDTPVRLPKAVGAAPKPTPDPRDLAFRKKKPIPKPAVARGTPGAKASPAPAPGPVSSLLSQTLAALSNKGTPSKPATKQDKKDAPTPTTADWRADYTLTRDAQEAYDASELQREKEKAERAKWKLNAVNLQQSKDIYKSDSDPRTLPERQIRLPDGSHIGIKTKAADVIKALWMKQDREKAGVA